MSESKFIDGLIVKAPNDRAPEYVKAKLSIKREELIAWLSSQSGDWINADIKVSQNGKWYTAVDDWKPEGGRGGGPTNRPQRQTQNATAGEDSFPDDAIPFVTNRSVW